MLATQIEDRTQPVSGLRDAELIRKFREGCNGAARTLHDRYVKRVRGIVEHNWPTSLRSRYDSEDVVQDIFGRFFLAVQRGIFVAPQNECVWGFLLVVTLNQIRKTVSQHLSARRDVRQTAGQGGSCLNSQEAPTGADSQVLSMLVVDELLASMPGPMRQAVECRLKGFTVPEIARDLLISQRAAERLMQTIRQYVSNFLDIRQLPGSIALLHLRKEPLSDSPLPDRARRETRQIKIA
jgi:DNA-directed RNA polymerase specialized sigma24 family protein